MGDKHPQLIVIDAVGQQPGTVLRHTFYPATGKAAGISSLHPSNFWCPLPRPDKPGLIRNPPATGEFGHLHRERH